MTIMTNSSSHQIMTMDPALNIAACLGDINFLHQALSERPVDYLLAIAPPEGKNFGGNIFHLAAWNKRGDFIKQAIANLPVGSVRQCLSQTASIAWKPLCFAAQRGDVEAVKLIVEFLKSTASDCKSNSKKAWVGAECCGCTSMYGALTYGLDDATEDCLLEILEMDPMENCNGIVGCGKFSPLMMALEKGYSRVAEKILVTASVAEINIDHQYRATPLHFAPNCSESVFRLLLEKYPECIDKNAHNGVSVLHQWADIGKDWICKLILEGDFPDVRSKVFKHLIYQTETFLATPLHIAAKNKRTEFGKILVHGYQQETIESSIQDCPPWRIQHKFGDTPLHSAMYSDTKCEELALFLLSVDPTLCQIYNHKGESPLFRAVESGCEQVVEEILRIANPRFEMLRRSDGQTVLHCLHQCTEKTGRRLIEKYWWISNLVDDNRKTALDKAKEADCSWLINLLTNPSLVNREPFNWIEALKNEETSAVVAFIDNCQDLQKLCVEEDDTPLHHIKQSNFKDYLKFLKIPAISELKNFTDFDGATPLHRALERKDMVLVKVLLTDNGVERTIRDHNGKTPMDLLAKLCRENKEWAKMCKHIKVNPHLRTSYIQPGTNLAEMRNTLSVVAALLATITFAAAFTLPGGVNSETGNAILAKKAAFLVFLLADVYAMCTSMLVLFCLIWSMVSEPDVSRLLIDRSVLILMQSLYGTLLAFVTGIYTVIWHNSLWAAILIFVMCSIIGVSANRTILHYVIEKFIPAAYIEQPDQIRLLEEGNTSRNGIDSSEGHTELPKV